MGVVEAKDHIRKRERENNKKWTRVYQKEWFKWVAKDKQSVRREKKYFDFWHPDLYDLVIDTYKYSREETLDQVLKELGV